jgi:hypothetical protein
VVWSVLKLAMRTAAVASASSARVAVVVVRVKAPSVLATSAPSVTARGGGGGYGAKVGALKGRKAGSPEVVPGTAEVRGSLDKELIRRIIRRHINEVKFCYERELTRYPDMEGRVMVNFTIGADRRRLWRASCSPRRWVTPPVSSVSLAPSSLGVPTAAGWYRRRDLPVRAQVRWRVVCLTVAARSPWFRAAHFPDLPSASSATTS